jgi:HSP20 family protein
MPATLTKPEPRAPRAWEPFRGIREEMENLWTQVAPDFGEGWFGGRLVPSADLCETATSVEVRMDLPGLKPEEIDIQLANNVLTVSGERKAEKEEKGQTFHRVERRRGAFSRSLTLPSAVVEDKVEAQYRDGVLTITLQKTDEAKSRKIKVKS